LAEEYKAWIMRGNNPTKDMGFAAFCSFCETAVNTASFMATPTLQHGHGMNAVEDNPSAASLTDAVSNFGVAYAAMQESLHNNNASISAMQGQIQMLCNALGNQPPAGMLQYPQQTNQGCSAQAANLANKDNPAAGVVAPTTAAGKTDSTEATAIVAGITKAAV
jgi:hypothetical protein